MKKHGIRTAKSADFTDAGMAVSYAQKHFDETSQPLVIKADGLAAGKGVVIASNLPEARAALGDFMESKTLGNAGSSVLLEEFIDGKEVSILAAVSVKAGRGIILPFISARDHKSRLEGGMGPNTGGMGAIAPVGDFSGTAYSDFITSILEPSLKGIQAENLDYRGFIFFGLMIHGDRCYLLEYNVRLGDPEAEAVLPLLDNDIVDLCGAIQDGTLDSFPLKWKAGAVCAPVAVADGYPGSYRKGDIISIDQKVLDTKYAKIFVSGAVTKNGPALDGREVTDSGFSTNDSGFSTDPHLCTSGGRVLVVSAFGTNADEAYNNAYGALEAVHFTGMGFRRDIGRQTAL